MIDADDAKRRTSRSFWKLDCHGRFGEDSVDTVDRDGVVWIGGLSTTLAYIEIESPILDQSC